MIAFSDGLHRVVNTFAYIDAFLAVSYLQIWKNNKTCMTFLVSSHQALMIKALAISLGQDTKTLGHSNDQLDSHHIIIRSQLIFTTQRFIRLL